MSELKMTTLMWFISQLGRITCFVGAIMLAYSGLNGWGWFLFVGLLCGYSYTTSDKNDTKE